jgi:hypothetical protein
MKKISHSGYRFSPEVIHQAIWLYLRFIRSLRDVEDLLAERGVAVSYETVRRWVNHFRPMIAADLRRRRLKPRTTWHLDEVYLKIDGRMVYLSRAVDSEDEVRRKHWCGRDRRCFSRPTRGQQVERLAGLDENRVVACCRFIALGDNSDVERADLDPAKRRGQRPRRRSGSMRSRGTDRRLFYMMIDRLGSWGLF